MPLYNNFPYSNLHELNLDWVIAKLKDVDKAQAAAEDVVDLVTRAETAATNAEASETAAASSASDAHADMQTASGYAMSANNSALNAGTRAANALTYANNAQNSANAAAASAADALTYANAASQSKTDAQTAAGNALTYKQNAETAATNAANSAASAVSNADRAQLYGAATGIHAYAGTVDSYDTETIAADDGVYIFMYYTDDQLGSYGLLFLKKTGDHKDFDIQVVYNGNTQDIQATNTGFSFHNISTAETTYLLIGVV